MLVLSGTTTLIVLVGVCLALIVPGIVIVRNKLTKIHERQTLLLERQLSEEQNSDRILLNELLSDPEVAALVRKKARQKSCTHSH
jgi:hypothetical protein